MEEPKLRIGLLLDGAHLPAWAHRLIAIIQESDFAEVSLVAGVSHVSEQQRALSARGLWRAPILGALLAVERFLVGKPGLLPDASAPVDGAALPVGLEVLPVVARGSQGRISMDTTDLDIIKAYSLDVLVQVGRGVPHDHLVDCAKLGVWAFQHGDPRPSHCGISGYWEVMRSSPSIESTLWMRTRGGDRVLYQSFSSTQDMSLADNQSNVLWKALHFVPRRLRSLYNDGRDGFLSRTGSDASLPPPPQSRVRELPGLGELGALLFRKFAQKLGRKLGERLYFRQWFLLYDMAEDMPPLPARFRHLRPPKDRCWADPFAVARGDKYFLFIEELIFARGRGHISVIEMHRDGSFLDPVPIIETAYHLSYPFVFEFEGTLYLIPESGGNRTIDIYRCTSFPYKWEYHRTLMRNLRAVDATLLQWGTRWWMFVNQAETDGASTWDELFLYYSDSPLSDHWIPHRRNPVVSDTRSARPAGHLFSRDGRLYRPSQNCSGHYGYGFNICEIKELSEFEYREQVVAKVEPNWNRNIISTHTLNYAAGLTIIDGQLRRRR